MKASKINHINQLLDHIHFDGSNFSCRIFPNLGGSIQELIIDDIDIIKGISLDESGISEYLAKYQSAVLFPFPNRLEDGRYTFDGKSYEFPINNSETNNAIHGFLHDKAFEVAAISNNILKLQYNDRINKSFPFNYSFGLVYTLSRDQIKIQFSIENNGEHSLPFGLGWHPYFQLDTIEGSTLQFSADKKYTTTERLLPNGFEEYNNSIIQIDKVSLDTAFNLTAPTVTLKTASYELRLQTPEDCYLQIYTPPDRQSIAIEPMTCIANAFNNGIGLKTVLPGEKYTWDINLNISTKHHDGVPQ